MFVIGWNGQLKVWFNHGSTAELFSCLPLWQLLLSGDVLEVSVFSTDNWSPAAPCSPPRR